MTNLEEILTAAWRVYLAWPLAALGVWLCARGLGMYGTIPSQLRDPHRALIVARSFRIAILGGAFVAVATGWLLSTGWVVLVALLILGEEMLESSTMIAALRAGVRTAAARPGETRAMRAR